jgi:nitrate/TMAO reductase-like tetraheme cytochrome c subunit
MASRRYPTQFAGPDGWTDWVMPVMEGYRMACCDCGLVHEMKFAVVKVVSKSRDGTKKLAAADPTHEVLFKARRHNRATAQHRRHKGKI